MNALAPFAHAMRDENPLPTFLPPWDLDADYRAERVARGIARAACETSDAERKNALLRDLWTPAEIAALWPEMFPPPPAPAEAVCRRTAETLERLAALADGRRKLPPGRDFRQFLLSELTTAAAMCRAAGGQVS